MSFFVAAHGAQYPTPNAGPIWRIGLPAGSLTINEGDTAIFTLQLLNPQVGAEVVWAMTNNAGQGSVIGSNNWIEDFPTVVGRVCAAAGLTLTVLTTTSTPPRNFTQDLMIQMLPGSTYQGQILTFPMVSRKNKANDISPRTSQCVLLRKVNAADPDSFRNIGGNLSIIDTSRTPTGNPIFYATTTALDGVSVAKTSFFPGDGFQVHVNGQNIIPGTKIKMFAANAAQYYLKPPYRNAMLAAITPPLAPPGITFEQTTYPPPAGQAFYNGYTIVFGPDYAGATISFNLIFNTANPDPTIASQFDVISSVTAEGTASDFTTTKQAGNWDSTLTYNYGDIITYTSNGNQYIALQGVGKNLPPDTNTAYWRPYTATEMHGNFTVFVQLPPARFWEIRAVTDGTTITYALQVPVGTAANDAVNFNVANAPPQFAANLQAALAAAGCPVSYDGTKFTVTAAASYANCSITWQAAHSGAGPHTLNLSSFTVSPITIGDTVVFLTPLTPVADPKFVSGVNNSGGEFGTVPGVYGTDYRYPSTPEAASNQHQPLDYAWAMGVRVMRLPVRWNRIQRNGQYTALSGEKAAGVAWDGSTAYDIARVDDIIAYWTGLGGILLLDLHNYGARGSDGAVGYDQPVLVPAWLDVMQRLALRYKNNLKVWFDPMNEPGWSAERCRENFQWLVNFIRSTTGAQNKFIIEGTSSSSAANWVANGQGAAYADFYDPANNFAFSPHLYVDGDGSGQSGICIANGQNRASAVIAWAKQYGFKLLFGETAGGSPVVSGQSNCASVMQLLYQTYTGNPTAVLGWTTWGYGPRWPTTYTFLLNPPDYTVTTTAGASPCMQMLLPFLGEQF